MFDVDGEDEVLFNHSEPTFHIIGLLLVRGISTEKEKEVKNYEVNK